ncbi:hypothetical protein MLD38_011322 [Melastoma candidum]|uniref:Uncharacterized protein n=1 Tax=Melastoma candidum TaxID=119954 RepID=A0ACB9R2Q9_9MYRT|nr:hypothetical protein MLD38_011322 [Melastoma candidum]
MASSPSSKTLLDFFHRPSKRVKLPPSSSSTSQILPSMSTPAASDFSADAASPSDLTPSQRSRIELSRLLAASRRNLRICSDKVSVCRKDGGVAYVKLDELLVDETWRDVLLGELEKPYAQNLCKFLESEICSGVYGSIGSTDIYPPQPYIFNALNSTPFDRVKAVILGQDPYHGPGQAMGLAFSVPMGVKPPSSLVNIFKELQQDLGCPIPSHGNLERWAVQGVLLLNAVLTVRSHKANSHAKKGWEQFTDAVIKTISEKKKGVIFLLWGNSAQAKLRLIDEARHHILKAAHPSGLSANRGFFGCRHFSRTNLILEKMGTDPIDWQL